MDRIISAVLILTSLFVGTLAFSQDNTTAPKKFYEKGYVTKPLVRPGENRGSTESASAKHPADASNSQASPEPEIELPPTLPVQSISAVINGIDHDHFEKCLTELVQVLTKYDLRFGHLYSFSDPRIIGELMQQKPSKLFNLIARGGEINLISAPMRYNTTTSPTWILETEKGEIVLEATGPLANNFNSKGEYIDKPSAKGIPLVEVEELH